LVQALLAALEEAAEDRSIGAVLLDAEAPVFCAGMDLEEAPTIDPAALVQLQSKLFDIGRTFAKPIIAAIQGNALGGGVALVANAHVVFASETAQFGLTELRVGMWPFLAWRPIAAAIGERRTLELALTTRLFAATEAQQWGLVHQVLPDQEVAAKAREAAEAISESSTEAITRGLRAVANPTLSASLRLKQSTSADFREGVQAFLEKRKPKWPSNK
jgi:enoyl-CoA hydratase/carnithine racemase